MFAGAAIALVAFALGYVACLWRAPFRVVQMVRPEGAKEDPYRGYRNASGLLSPNRVAKGR